jgi:hypothetical protein
LAEKKSSFTDYSKEVIKVTKDLNRARANLKKLQREFQFAGTKVTQSEIDRQQKLVDTYQQVLDQLTEETEAPFKEQIKTKQEELRERESRALEERAAGQVSQDVALPLGPDGEMVSGELTAETRRLTKQQLEKARKTLQTPREEKEPTESAYQRPLTSAPSVISDDKVFISGVELNAIQPMGPGKFVVQQKFDQDPDGYLILSPSGGRVSRLVSVNDFTNNLYQLDSSAISEYQKALGLSQSGVMNRELENRILTLVEDVSYLNYRNALVNRSQIQWEEALINPEKFNLKGLRGDGAPAGPSAEQIRARAQSIELLSTELGIDLEGKDLQRLARDWASGLYDANTIRAQIARVGTIDFNKGAAAETLNTLKQYASDLGIEFDETWFNKAATRILKYKDDSETYNQQIRDFAKSQYPTLAEQIDAGFTVRQLASPYIQNMSRILEIDPGTIGLNDRTIKQALTGLNPEGKPMTTPLWQFEQELRQDPRWNYTNNAQEDLMGTARDILRNFGLVS